MTIAQHIVQMCYIVDNLDQAVNHWVETIGAGPFFVQNNLGVPVEYKGSPGTLDINLALGQAGSLQIELIEMNSSAPSVYSDTYRKGETGFHHIAVFVEEFEAMVQESASRGSPLNTRGEFAGGKFCYIDTRAAIGCFTELYEEAAGMRGMYKAIAAAAKDWDMKVRTYPFAEALR